VIRGDGADSGVDSGVDQGADSGVGAGRLELPAHLTRLRLACCNPRLVQDTGAPASSKLATFAETLDELLANRHKVPMFSQVVTTPISNHSGDNYTNTRARLRPLGLRDGVRLPDTWPSSRFQANSTR